MPDTETTVAQKRQRLHAIEAEYLRTKDFLKSSEWAVKRDHVLMRLSSTMGLYNPVYKPNHDATTAVFVLAQAKQIMLEIQEVTDVIIEFEALREELRRYDERMG